MKYYNVEIQGEPRALLMDTRSIRKLLKDSDFAYDVYTKGKNGLQLIKKEKKDNEEE